MRRAFAYAWASPNTILALILLLLSLPLGARARVRDGVLEADGGPISWALRRIPFFKGALALTLGHVVFARSREDQEHCRTHERVHVRQYEKWGPLFLPAYLVSSLRARMKGGQAYRDNRFEREAFTLERRSGEHLR